MFLAAKFLAFITQPLAWVALLVLGSCLCTARFVRCGQWLGTSAFVLLVALGWEPLPDAVLRQLESVYPALPSGTRLDGYEGVIVLGGALEPSYVWAAPGQSALNDAAERMTEVLPLLRRQPSLRVLFTGGEGELFASHLPEAARAKQFFTGQGLPADAFLFESASRTTYENALLSKSVPGVNPAKPWLLLTSAWHMPRAMATFKSLGWQVTAYPVDFRTGQSTPWSQYTMDQGVKKWKTALHELLGLLAYRLSGRL
ncbi:YdcF family protein [Rhodoferax sp.]|uniref:YdcF family protein n=1 Tax=Rhodoferax sp. TaxID=50421 RepID=UPI00261D57AE|nr:YdcF family protein [Rhodoferax sp.]MDD4943158.1 YdcF family protein [Rhodoferax sp.]MDD5478583.1 YdcF family protein [Rhodoferax sp.]